MSNGLSVSIQYVNWIGSELDAIKGRLKNSAKLADLVDQLVCQSASDIKLTLDALFDGPLRMEFWDAQAILLAGRMEDGIDELDLAFFERLEASGEIALCPRHRFLLLAIVHRVLLNRTGHIVEAMRAIVEAAKPLLQRIRDYGPPTFPIALPIPGLDLSDTASFLCHLEKIADFDGVLSEYEEGIPTPKGRPREWRQDALAILLTDLYVASGGAPTLDLDEDQNKLVGPFAAFLATVWGALPESFTSRTSSARVPVSAQTFVHRARDLRYGLQEMRGSVVFQREEKLLPDRREAIFDAVVGLHAARVDYKTVQAEIQLRFPDITAEELLEAIKTAAVALTPIWTPRSQIAEQ